MPSWPFGERKRNKDADWQSYSRDQGGARAAGGSGVCTDSAHGDPRLGAHLCTRCDTRWTIAPIAPPVDVVESDGAVIRGWRFYTAMTDYDWRIVLSGSQRLWPERTLVAKCDDQGVEQVAEHLLEASPYSCGCGIYAVKEQAQLPMGQPVQYVYGNSMGWQSGTYPSGTMSKTAPVLAECVLWGTVLESETGYRATHARIERLCLAEHDAEHPILVRSLEERYGVRVDVMNEKALLT